MDAEAFSDFFRGPGLFQGQNISSQRPIHPRPARQTRRMIQIKVRDEQGYLMNERLNNSVKDIALFDGAMLRYRWLPARSNGRNRRICL